MSHPILGPITLIISDVGTSIPTAHAASHAPGGDDPLAGLALSQISGAGTMAGQNASNVAITGGAIAGVTFSSSAVTITGGSVSGITLVCGNATLSGGTINGMVIGGSSPANATFLDVSCEDLGVSGGLDVAGALALGVPLEVTAGGTGADNDADARTNLGVGTMGTQSKAAVDIEGGTIDNTVIGGTTKAAGGFTAGTFTGNVIIGGTLAVTGTPTFTVPLPVASGGTGANTAALARAALDLEPGVDVQAYDADLAAIAGLVSAADRLPYYTGAGTAALAVFTSYGRQLVTLADNDAFYALTFTRKFLDATYSLTAGTVTVVDAAITSTSVVIPIPTGTGGGTPGHLSVFITAGVGFTIDSTEATDDRTLNCLICY